MKKYIYILQAILLLHFPVAWAQKTVFQTVYEERAFKGTDIYSNKTLLALFLASDPTMNESKQEQIQQRLDNFCASLLERKASISSEKRFLRIVFSQVHKEFLLKYNQYPPFHQLFVDGIYNCVSGTALYTMILNKLGYSVSIHETAFHAYLKVNAKGKQYLIDATDQVGGFVSSPVQIRQQEAFYAANERKLNQPYFNRTINLTELCGLHYYNEATLHYNKQEFNQSKVLLDKAAYLYSRSERIDHLRGLAAQYKHGYYEIVADQNSKKQKQHAD